MNTVVYKAYRSNAQGTYEIQEDTLFNVSNVRLTTQYVIVEYQDEYGAYHTRNIPTIVLDTFEVK